MFLLMLKDSLQSTLAMLVTTLLFNVKNNNFGFLILSLTSLLPTCKTYQGQKLLFNKPNPLTPGGAAQVSTESPIVTSSIITSETIKPIMQVYNERKLISIRTPYIFDLITYHVKLDKNPIWTTCTNLMPQLKTVSIQVYQ